MPRGNVVIQGDVGLGLADRDQVPSESEDESTRDGVYWWRRLLNSPTVWIFAIVCVLGYLLLDWIDAKGGPEAVRQQYGIATPVVTVITQIILALTPFPSDVVPIANGMIFPFRTGVALSWFAWWLAALAEFALGRRARKDFCIDTALVRAPGWIQRFPISHPLYLILSRQIPWLGGHVSTFIPGAAGVSWRRYLWCSAIAIIPGAVVMTGIGAGLNGWPVDG